MKKKRVLLTNKSKSAKKQKKSSKGEKNGNREQ